MAKYKNITDQELIIVGIGVVEAGGEIETDQEINSQNLELIIEQPVKAAGKDSDVSN